MKALFQNVRMENGARFYKLSSVLSSLGDVRSYKVDQKNDRILTSLDLKTLLSPKVVMSYNKKIEGYLSKHTKDLIVSLLHEKYLQ